MPVFEIESGGQIYEVDAPDQQSALTAFESYMPQEASPPGQMEPPPEPRSTGVGDFLNRAGNWIPFADEIRAGAYALPALGTDEDFMDRYRDYKSADEARAARIERDMPDWQKVAADTAGLGYTMATGGLAAPALGLSGTGVRTAAGQGTALGAVSGFSEGDSLEERSRNMLIGGGLGGALGAGGQKVGEGIARAVTPMRELFSETTEAARRRASQQYERLLGSNITVRSNAYDDIVEDIAGVAEGMGARRRTSPVVTGIIRDLAEEMGSDKSLRDMDALRRVMKVGAGSARDQERAIANAMIARFDDRLERMSRNEIVGDGAEGASAALRNVRQQWSRVKKAELLEDALDRAVRRAARTGSGGNVENTIRQNLDAILNNPKKVRGFTAEERQALRDIVEGTRTQNALRLIGKLGISGNGLNLLLNLIGGYATGGASLVVPATGEIAKRLADRGTRTAAQNLVPMVRGGSANAPARMRPPLTSIGGLGGALANPRPSAPQSSGGMIGRLSY